MEHRRGVQEDGGLFTLADLANWKVHIEEPVFVLPQLAALLIYVRNLYLVRREKKAA